MHAANSRQPLHLFLAIALVLLPGLTEGQTQSRSIDRSPSCVGCTIVPERILTLGAPTDSVNLTMNSLVFRDARGRYYARGYEGHNFVVFDSTGKYLRAVGRPGDGPGEFRSVRGFALGRADSLLVFHGERVTVFTPELQYARTFSLPTESFRATGLSNGNLLVDNRTTPGTPPLLIVTPTGTTVRDFGGPPDPAACYTCAKRVVQENSGSRVWLGLPTTYALQLWDTTGTIVETLTQRIEWFTPWNSEPPGEMSIEEIMLQPQLMRMSEDAQGRLWTQGIAPDPKFSPSLVPPSAAPPDLTGDPAAFSNAFARHFNQLGALATINHVEIIDTRAARLVLSAELPDGLVLMPGGLASSVREDANGIVHHDIWRLVVRPR